MLSYRPEDVKHEFQLSQWVNTEKELDFMRKQLAKYGVPSRIVRSTDGKFAVMRPTDDPDIQKGEI